MFFVQIARLTVRVLKTFRRGLLLATVLLAVACLGWLKHSTAVIQNPVAIVVSAASNETDALAPDSLATAYGARLAVQSDIAATPQTELAGTTVTVAGRSAALLFASPEQINFLIPAGTPAGSATVRVRAADGTISEGTTIINAVAPALFTAGEVVSGFALRVKADGAQSYEAIAEFDAASGQFKTKAIDLNSAAGDQVFLVFFLSGLRNADPAQVRVILGGDAFAPVFAGAVPGAPGLDQINLLLSRDLVGKGVLDLTVAAPNARPSKPAKIEIGGGASTLAVSKLSKQTVVAGETLEIEGANLPTSNVEVLFEPNVGVAPETVTPTKMTLRVPYGVATGAVKISVNKQIAYVSPQPLNVVTSVSGFVEEFKDGRRVAVVGLPVVLTEPGGRSLETVTNNAGAFLIRDAAVSTSSIVQIKGQAVNGLNYETPPFRLRVFGNRDNQASREDTTPRLLELEPNGTVTTSLTGANTPLNETLRVAAPNETAGVITAGQVTFDTGNSTINCPGGASSCQLALAVFDPGRTPTNLPTGVFSSTIAQITPFGATLTPGGKLTFPNSDGIPSGTPVQVYYFNQTPSSASFGQFEPIGAGTISSDGQRLETAANVVKQASYYFISRQWPTATVIGHVVEADGVRPVRRAVVSARGQSTFTDGNGGFVLRNIPVIKANDTVTLEVSFHRADGTITRTERAGIAISENAQVQLATDIPLPARSATNGPTILAPATLSITEGETRDFNFLVTDLPTGVTPALVSSPSFAALRSLGADAFALRLAPPTGSAGNYQITIGAGDARQTVTAIVIVAGSNAPIARSQAVTTNEDTPVQITLSATNAGSAPTYTITAQPLHGSLSGTPPNLTYTPAANYNGTDSFSFRVGSGNDPRSTAVVSIAVRPVNDPPVITSTFSAQSVNAGQTIKLIITAEDPDGDPLICSAPNAPVGATQNPPQVAQNRWQFSWTPIFVQSGIYAINLRVADDNAAALADSRIVQVSVDAKWAQTSGIEGGIVISLGVSGNTLLAGTEDGGIYRSTNKGQSWVPVKVGLPPGITVYAIAVRDGQFFIGTKRAGVFRSTNDGESWLPFGNGLENNDVFGLTVRDQRLFAARDNGVFVLDGDGGNWRQASVNLVCAPGRNASVGKLAANNTHVFAGTDCGVFRSADNGESWQRVNGVPTACPGMPSFVYSLTANGNDVYAGISACSRACFVSTDSGESWMAANAGLPFANLRSLTVKGTSVYAGTEGEGVFISNNKGGNWQPINSGLPFSKRVFALITAPSGIFAGLDIGGVFALPDQSQQWQQANKGLGSAPIGGFAVDGQRVYAANGGSGVAVTENNGQSWTVINQGLPNLDVPTVALHKGLLFAGTNGSGVFASSDQGRSWMAVNNGLPANARIFKLFDDGQNLFAGTFNTGIYRSTNQGQNWMAVNIGLPFISGNGQNFYPTFWAFARIGTRLFAGLGGDGVYVSTNGGASWGSAAQGLERQNVRALAVSGSVLFAATFGNSAVYRLGEAATNWVPVNNGIGGMGFGYLSLAAANDVVFVGTVSNGVFFTTDQGENWRLLNNGANDVISLSLMATDSKLFLGTLGGVRLLTNNVQSWNERNRGLNNRFANSVVQTGSAILVGTLGGGVFRSSNQGQDWLPNQVGLPPGSNVQSLSFSTGRVFAGLFEQGVYQSADDGKNWIPLNDGLPTATNPQQNPRNINVLRAIGGTLLAATDGGTFRLGDITGSWAATNLTRRVLSLLVNGATIFSGTADDGVYRSTDDGRSWQAAGKQGLGNLTVLSLGVSADGSKLFAGTDGGIYRSDDSGATWRAVNRDLPSNLVVTSFQTSGAKLYAGSVYGVFLSEDNGENWKQINAGLLDIYATSLALDGDRLIAGTKVGGVFISQIPNQSACIGIASQPAGKTISSGQSATLSVTPSGDQPFQFQWYQGASGDFSRPIAGATGSAYTTPLLAATTNYWVLVTNGCGSVNSETVSVIVNAVPQTDLAITQTISPAQPKPGDTLTFTFTLANRGGEKALAVNVTNPLPVEVDFVSCTATGGGVCGGAGNNRTVFFSEIAGNASATVTLTAKVKADAGGKTLRNNAGVSAATNDANLGNNSDPKSVTVQQTAPLISGLNPAMAVAGGAGFTLAVNGSNFVNGAKVRWKGSERATSFGSATQLTAQIPATDLAAAGTATVTVVNPDGQVSAGAGFTITAPQRPNSVLRVVASTGGVGSTVAVPIELVAQGDENALGFSLTFDPTILSNPQPALGSGASGATLNPNLSQVTAGRLGLALAMPSGQRFAAGVRQIVVVTFAIAANTGAATANLEFGSQPIAREVSDADANELGASYMGGAVTITRGFEADVAPRPNGNGALSVTDWVLVGRFASGDLAVEPGSEFQRADCAPRASFGNGAMTVTDWVQAGRYAAGLDPQAPAAGPTAPAAFAPTDLSTLLKTSGWPRLLRVGSPTFSAGQTSAVTVELLAQGEENAVSFSLQFDARQWRFVSATLGEDAQKAALSINAKFAADGHVGFALALPPGQKLEAGMRSLLTVNFVAVEGGGLDAPQPAFSDWPTARELADAKAEVLAADWMPAGLSLFKVSASEDWAAGVAIRVGADGAQRFEPLTTFDPAQNKFVAVPIEVGDEREQVFLALFGKGWQQGLAPETIEVMVDDVRVEVLYAGEQAAGTAQLNLRLPPTLKGRGEVAVRFGYAGRPANPVKVFIK